MALLSREIGPKNSAKKSAWKIRRELHGENSLLGSFATSVWPKVWTFYGPHYDRSSNFGDSGRTSNGSRGYGCPGGFGSLARWVAHSFLLRFWRLLLSAVNKFSKSMPAVLWDVCDEEHVWNAKNHLKNPLWSSAEPILTRLAVEKNIFKLLTRSSCSHRICKRVQLSSTYLVINTPWHDEKWICRIFHDRYGVPCLLQHASDWSLMWLGKCEVWTQKPKRCFRKGVGKHDQM